MVSVKLSEKMKKRIIVTAVVLAAIHFVLVIGLAMIAFVSGMETFDNPDYQPSMVGSASGFLAGILMQPGISLWTPWMSENMHDVIEWGLYFFNSFLWGVIFALVMNVPKLLKGKKLSRKQ
ncbi:MAG: hypothetical protein ABFS43_13710 [Thermodesulfobacteriota bacterium]